jgi:hypothetical protein
MFNRSLGTVAVIAGLLAAATPAHAGTLVGNPGKGTAVFSADAYDNEMGFRAALIVPEVDDEVL